MVNTTRIKKRNRAKKSKKYDKSKEKSFDIGLDTDRRPYKTLESRGLVKKRTPTLKRKTNVVDYFKALKDAPTSGGFIKRKPTLTNGLKMKVTEGKVKAAPTDVSKTKSKKSTLDKERSKTNAIARRLLSRRRLNDEKKLKKRVGRKLDKIGR